MSITLGNYELVILENPLLDIIVRGNDALLDKYKLKRNDSVLAQADQMPIFEELITQYKPSYTPGGAAQNTARGAQYLLPPHSVVYLGCVGKDKYADRLREEAAKARLRVDYRVDPDKSTGRCAVIVNGHNRSMCTDLAAANCYTIDHLKEPSVWKLVETAKAFYIGGYHFTACVSAVMAIAQEAASNNKLFSFSLSAPFIPTVFQSAVNEVIPYCDIIFANETEARAWADTQSLSTTYIPYIAQRLAKFPLVPKKNPTRQRIVIITQGTDPTIVATTGCSTTKSTSPFDESSPLLSTNIPNTPYTQVLEYPVHPVLESEINDTNGAGDAFAAGFLAAILQNASLSQCIDQAHWLAKLTLHEVGPNFPQPPVAYRPSDPLPVAKILFSDFPDS